MQDPDPIEKHFNRSFSGFEAPPPENSWEKIRDRLHPAGSGSGKMMNLFVRIRQWGFSSGLNPVAGTAAIILLILFIWISYSHKHNISGHAYAGESRICKGIALLYQVYDKTEPIDTVKLIMTVRVDGKGFYQFSGIKDGSYLIKVIPGQGSEAIKNYQPSFYDQDRDLSKANVIRVKTEDPVIDIHLLPR